MLVKAGKYVAHVVPNCRVTVKDWFGFGVRDIVRVMVMVSVRVRVRVRVRVIVRVRVTVRVHKIRQALF